MRARFTESVAGTYFSHFPGEEVEVGSELGQLDPVQAQAWLASGTLVALEDAPESAVVGGRETAMREPARRRR